MTAKEMFEKLGYEYSYNGYVHKYEGTGYLNTILEFDELIKTIRISQADEEYAQTINVQELQAINKQCEELGWANEQK